MEKTPSVMYMNGIAARVVICFMKQIKGVEFTKPVHLHAKNVTEKDMIIF